MRKKPETPPNLQSANSRLFANIQNSLNITPTNILNSTNNNCSHLGNVNNISNTNQKKKFSFFVPRANNVSPFTRTKNIKNDYSQKSFDNISKENIKDNLKETFFIRKNMEYLKEKKTAQKSFLEENYNYNNHNENTSNINCNERNSIKNASNINEKNNASNLNLNLNDPGSIKNSNIDNNLFDNQKEAGKVNNNNNNSLNQKSFENLKETTLLRERNSFAKNQNESLSRERNFMPSIHEGANRNFQVGRLAKLLKKEEIDKSIISNCSNAQRKTFFNNKQSILDETNILNTENDLFEKELNDFFLNSTKENNNISVLAYLENFFTLLEKIQNQISHKPLKNAINSINKIVKLPFERMVDLFEKMKIHYEKKTNENSKNEVRKLDDCVRSLFKENEKLKEKLKENENKENMADNLKNFIDKNIFKNIVQKQKNLNEKESILTLTKEPKEEIHQTDPKLISNSLKNMNFTKFEPHDSSKQFIKNSFNFDKNEHFEKSHSRDKLPEDLKAKLKLDLAKVKEMAFDQSCQKDIQKLQAIHNKNMIQFYNNFVDKSEESVHDTD